MLLRIDWIGNNANIADDIIGLNGQIMPVGDMSAVIVIQSMARVQRTVRIARAKGADNLYYVFADSQALACELEEQGL